MPERELILRIEQAALWAWPPKETAYVEGWLLRASGGHTRRVNSVQTNKWEEGTDLGRAIARAEAWYGTRGLPPCFQINDVTEPEGLDAELDRRGYARITPTSVRAAEAGALLGMEAGDVELLPRATQAVANALFDLCWPEATRRERAALFARIRRPHRFGLVSLGGVPAAGGLVVVDGDLAGIFSMHTQPPFRRQGLARRVLLALTAWAARHGASTVYLQVEADNAPALALYDAAGFRHVYGYHYREG
jgi:ribosomal protein S18 acetylase RimI-like enzyme